MAVLENFIVFEGLDGAGTSTQIDLLKKRLPEALTVCTAEPTAGEAGKLLRKMLSSDIQVHPATAAYLFAADRCEHVFGTHGIKELTESGRLVISDRYLFSSLAYQSATCGRELPEMLNSYFPLPEHLFFFDIQPEVSLARVDGRGSRELYEQLDFQKKTDTEYRRILGAYRQESETAEKNGEPAMRIHLIDAAQPVDAVAKKIWDIIGKLPILNM